MSSFSDLTKFLTKRSTLMVLGFALILFGLYTYSSSKTFVMDRMTDSSLPSAGSSSDTMPAPSGIIPEPIQTPVSLPNGGTGYNNRDVMNPNDLLPKDTNSEWANLNPVNANKVIGSDLLDSSAFMGQVSQYRGIPNYDIRALPVIIPKDDNISPWLNSAISPDIYNNGLKQ